MAERIESGRMQIANVGSSPMQRVAMPGVDYVGARAQAQAAGTLAEVLDRMSAYAFGEAKTLRTEEGMQYVAENPPTPEQLEAAKNGDVSSLVPDGRFTYFDKAVRKARSFELSSHFEQEGMNELNKLLTDISAGTATSEQVAQRIKTLTDGFATSLAKVEPEAALKFRATMATHGNTVLNAAYKEEVKQAKDRRRVKFDMFFDNGVRLLETTAAQHPGQFDAYVDLFRTNMAQHALLQGDAALQKEYSTKFETEVRNAKINALTKHLSSTMTDSFEVIQKLQTGDAGEMSPILMDLIENDFEAVIKIETNLMEMDSRRNVARQRKREQDKQADYLEFLPIYRVALSAPYGSPERQDAIDQISEIADRGNDAVPFSAITALNSPEAEGNRALEFNVAELIRSGQVRTSAEIWDKVSPSGLNASQAIRLAEKLESFKTKGESKLDRRIAKLAGIPIVTGQTIVLDKNSEQLKATGELEAKAADIRDQALRAGKVMTDDEVGDALEVWVRDKAKTKAIEDATKLLATYEAKEWVNGKITRDSIPTLRIKAKGNRTREAELQRIIEQLDIIEGKK